MRREESLERKGKERKRGDGRDGSLGVFVVYYIRLYYIILTCIIKSTWITS
jgi:hypothetical protein